MITADEAGFISIWKSCDFNEYLDDSGNCQNCPTAGCKTCFSDRCKTCLEDNKYVN